MRGREAGSELPSHTANVDDWPHEWYERLGYVYVGQRTTSAAVSNREAARNDPLNVRPARKAKEPDDVDLVGPTVEQYDGFLRPPQLLGALPAASHDRDAARRWAWPAAPHSTSKTPAKPMLQRYVAPVRRRDGAEEAVGPLQREVVLLLVRLAGLGEDGSHLERSRGR